MSIQIYTFGIVLVAAHTGTGAGNLPDLGDERNLPISILVKRW